jgi:hypothetical protein
MFETVRVEFILRAVEPIVHQRETIGNQGVPMTRGLRMADGSYEDVPIVTADTMRHGMRTAVVLAYLDAAGLLGETQTEEALRLLFNGGNITGSAGGSVRMADYWKLCDIMPHLGLFGGNAQNRSVPGRLQVGDALIVCEETLPALPEHVREWVRDNAGTVGSYRSALEEEFRVAMDAALDPANRALLLPAHRARVEQRLLANEKASAEGDRQKQKENKSGMHPRSQMAVKAGELFYWYASATLLSELDRETFFVTLAAFLSHAKVGGKKAQGRGLIEAVKGWQVHVLRPSERTDSLDVRDIGGRVGELFRAHARERRDELASFLGKVAA